MNACPACRQTGVPVSRLTLEALCVPTALGGHGRRDGFRFCPQPACDVAYYDTVGTATICKQQVVARIGCKETASPRSLCYCFGHTVEEVEAEVRETGSAGALESISQKCREGLQRCEQTNPAGRCCLVDVRRVMRHARAKASRGSELVSTEETGAYSSSSAECCAPPPLATEESSRPAARTGALAAGGALVLAMASSACCWLPLALIAVGASSVGAAAFLDAYRPALLVGTGLMLATAFALVYRRPRPCAPGQTCPPATPRFERLVKPALWASTIAVAAFAFFPDAARDWLTPTAHPLALDVPAGDVEQRFDIDGLTCAGCAAGLQARLGEVPGVSEAVVSYPGGEARVWSLTEDASTVRSDVETAISDAGYDGTAH